MRTLQLAWHYLWARPLGALLNVLLLGLGLGSITFLMLVAHQLDKAFQRDLAGIDVVVGAKGSPMQLILSGVFHIDVPPGNIPLTAVRELEKHPAVAQLIPLSLGDSVQGFRIVGTTQDYLRHYQASLARGAYWNAPMQVVLGAQVAQALQLQVGATIHGAHGLGAGGAEHADSLYQVVGVLQPSGSVLDRLVLTSTESVWQVHEVGHAHGNGKSHDEGQARDDAHGHDAHAHDDAHDQSDDHGKASGLSAGKPAHQRALTTADADAKREITLALIRYHSPLAAVTFPRMINSSTQMQAAAPALEISRLLRMLGLGTDVLRGFAAVLLLTAGLSVFIALWNAVRERRADLALLRMLGASPAKVAALLLSEALWLGCLATVLGLLLGQAFALGLGHWLQLDQSLLLAGWVWPVSLFWVPVLALGIALLSAALPAWGAYRTSVMRLLQGI